MVKPGAFMCYFLNMTLLSLLFGAITLSACSSLPKETIEIVTPATENTIASVNQTPVPIPLATEARLPSPTATYEPTFTPTSTPQPSPISSTTPDFVYRRECPTLTELPPISWLGGSILFGIGEFIFPDLVAPSLCVKIR